MPLPANYFIIDEFPGLALVPTEMIFEVAEIHLKFEILQPLLIGLGKFFIVLLEFSLPRAKLVAIFPALILLLSDFIDIIDLFPLTPLREKALGEDRIL